VVGIVVFLFIDYTPNHPHFYLLDKTQLDNNVYYGFNERGAYYNSPDVARGTLTLNGVPESAITTLEANSKNSIDINVQVDLVISLISGEVTTQLEHTWKEFMS
jgi:hypothetical protein